MCFFIFIVNLLVMAVFSRTASADLGINCRGSALCHGAHLTYSSVPSYTITQSINDTVWYSKLSPSTVYNSLDHISCINVDKGNKHGICLFAQGASITLEEAKPLIAAVINHGCDKCGSVPVHFVDQNSNGPRSGILTFNYVANPACTGNCISANPVEAPSGPVEFMNPSPKFRRGQTSDTLEAIQP